MLPQHVINHLFPLQQILCNMFFKQVCGNGNIMKTQTLLLRSKLLLQFQRKGRQKPSEPTPAAIELPTPDQKLR